MAGNIERSQELIGRSLAVKPDQPAALRTFGTDYKYSYGDPVFTRLNGVASGLAEVAPLDQVQLHYALAKAYDDVNELETAYRHYAIAGATKRKLEKYNERVASRMFEPIGIAVCRERVCQSV